MIQTRFKRLEEFASIRDNCLFCGKKLKFVFTTTMGTSKPEIPLIKSNWGDNRFSFDLQYNSAILNVNAEVNINTRTNEISFNPNDTSVGAAALEGLSPHVELQCNNKKCKMNYYLRSSIFTFQITFETEEPCLHYAVNPFRLEWECFNVNKFWIKNDYSHKTTDIYSTESGFDHKPIMMPMLDFRAMDSDKIANKILTMVNFS